jgi:hypothetical protein
MRLSILDVRAPFANGTLTMRVREIKEADLPAVIALFVEAFPRRRRTYWQRGLANMGWQPVIPGHAQYGYLLEADGKVRGALLALSTEDGDVGQRINVSAWCAKPHYRTVAPLLHARVMKQKATSYLNLSPSEATVPIVKALGFEPYTGGVCLLDARAALHPARGWRLTRYRLSKDHCLPETLAKTAARHYRYGCTVLILRRGSGPAELLVYRVKWITGILPCAQMIYGAPDRVLAAAGPLMRHLIRRSIPLALVDIVEYCDMFGARTYMGRNLRYCIGPAPAVGDMLDSELALFDY